MEIGERTDDLGAIGINLVPPVVEPQDALRRVRDGNEVALALTQDRERQTEQDSEEERHFLAPVLAIPSGAFPVHPLNSRTQAWLKIIIAPLLLAHREWERNDSCMFPRPVALVAIYKLSQSGRWSGTDMNVL